MAGSIVKITVSKELRRHAQLTSQSFELLDGEELRVAIDISYDAVVEKNGRIDQEQLRKKNDELELLLLALAEKVIRFA